MKLHLIVISLLISAAWSTEETYGGAPGYPGSLMLRLTIDSQENCIGNATGPDCCPSEFFGNDFQGCFGGELYYMNGNLYGKRIGMSSAYCDISFPNGPAPSDGDKTFFLTCKQIFTTYWGEWVMDVVYEVCNAIDIEAGDAGHLLLSTSDGSLLSASDDSIDPYLTVVNSSLMPMSGSNEYDNLDAAHFTHGTGTATGIESSALPITNPLDLIGASFFDEIEDNLYYQIKLFFIDESYYKCNTYCGYKSPYGCWCDEECFAYGDCCYDACDSCNQNCDLEDEITEFTERPPDFEANGRGIRYSVYAAVAGGAAIVGMGAIFCFKRRRKGQLQ